MQSLASHSIAVLVFDGAMALDFTGPTDALMVANYYWRQEKGYTGDEVFYDFQYVGTNTAQTALSGLTVQTEKTIHTCAPSTFDAVLVPGGNGVFKAAENKDLINWITKAHLHSKRTISVCSGALLLAEAGLLGGHTCCTHWTLCRELAKRYPGIIVDPESIYIADGKIITSAGVTSGIDMTLALIEADLGRDIALKVARRLVVHLKRPGGQSQYSWPLKAQSTGQGDTISKAIRWVFDHLQEPLTVERIADAVGMSVRSFNRHFKEQIGESPARFVEQARLESARLLLEEDTSTPLAQAAAASGFSSPEHLSRAFERRYGVHPKQYRSAFKLN